MLVSVKYVSSKLLAGASFLSIAGILSFVRKKARVANEAEKRQAEDYFILKHL